MKLGLRLKIETTYTRGGEKKKPGHGEKAKEQWMKCALRNSDPGIQMKSQT